jgi:hypothetical protein
MQGGLGDPQFGGDVGVAERVVPPHLHELLGYVEDALRRIPVRRGRLRSGGRRGPHRAIVADLALTTYLLVDKNLAYHPPRGKGP